MPVFGVKICVPVGVVKMCVCRSVVLTSVYVPVGGVKMWVCARLW